MVARKKREKTTNHDSEKNELVSDNVIIFWYTFLCPSSSFLSPTNGKMYREEQREREREDSVYLYFFFTFSLSLSL